MLRYVLHWLYVTATSCKLHNANPDYCSTSSFFHFIHRTRLPFLCSIFILVIRNITSTTHTFWEIIARRTAKIRSTRLPTHAHYMHMHMSNRSSLPSWNAPKQKREWKWEWTNKKMMEIHVFWLLIKCTPIAQSAARIFRPISSRIFRPHGFCC